MISCIILIFLCISILFLSKRISRPICLSILFPIILFLNYYFKENNVWLFSLQIFLNLLILGLYIFIQTKIKYDFTGKIISYTYILNSIFKPNVNNGDRIIGKVLPYNNYQLRYNGKYITMNEISSAGSTLISGSSGSGKTWSMMSLMKQNITAGQSVIFAEYKGDPKIIKELSDFAKSKGFQIFTLSSGKSDFNYDPLQNLNNVGRIEAIMNMRKWSIDGSDAHYKTSVQLLLQKLVGEWSHKWNQNDSYTYSFYQWIKTYHPAQNEWDAYNTVSKLLELLITSNLEPMFKCKYGKTLDFNKLKNEKFVLIVSFVSSNKELATSFSSLLIRDLLDECTVSPPKFNINLYMDETGTLENPYIVKDTLEKGRSGKIASTLSMQDLNQFVIQANEAYLNSILGTINTFIIFAGATRNTAEKFAGVQLLDIENVLMNLRKPINGKSPTAIYISKYPTLNKKTNSEVFRFEPYIIKEDKTEKSFTKLGYFDDENNELSEYNENTHKQENFNSNNKQGVINNFESKNENQNIDNGNFQQDDIDVYDDFI